MSRQLWGCYAVADHLVPRAFVADVLLYERLVIPIPPSGDAKQQRAWEKAHWEPERQAELLKILGEIAEPVPWTEELRKEWSRRWSAAAVDEMRHMTQAKANPGGVSFEAAMLSIRLISEALARKVFTHPADIRTLVVYANAVNFDQEWRIDRAFPFVRRRRRVLPRGPRIDFDTPPPAEDYRLAKMLIGRFAVPEERGRSDEEMLKNAVELAGDPLIVRWRNDFHAWLGDMAGRNLRDQTIVNEMAELVEDYNRVVKRRRKAIIFRQGVTVVEKGAGAGAAFWGGPLAAAAANAPVAAIADIFAGRIWGETEAAPVRAAALLAEAKRRV